MSQYPDQNELDRRRENDPVWAHLDAVRERREQKRLARSMHNPTSEIVRLARDLGKDPDEVARAIPEDTLKRLRYPMRRTRKEDGTTVFEEPTGIVEGITSLARR